MCKTSNFFSIRIMPGLITLSIITFIFAIAIASVTLFVIIEEENIQYQNKFQQTDNDNHHLQHVFNVNLDKKSIDLIVSIFFVLSLLAMGFSVLLFIGIIQNRTNCVLSYFCYGILLLILFFLTSILSFLHGYWYIGTASFILFVIYIPCLQLVYSAYDVMQKGMAFGYYGHNLLVNEQAAE